MNKYTILFPDRVVGEHAPACSCSMAMCGTARVQRGAKEIITANSKHDAWDRMKRKYPFERIEVVNG